MTTQADLGEKRPAARLYFEEQRFRQFWLWLTLLATAGGTWYALIAQVLLGTPLGDRPAPDLVLVLLWAVFGVGLPVLFFAARLVTEVREDALYLNFVLFPFTRRRIRYDELLEARSVSYRPIRDYGGWGIRYGRGGRAYNVSGNEGVQLEFRDGKRLLIGSQNAGRLALAIQAKSER